MMEPASSSCPTPTTVEKSPARQAAIVIFHEPTRGVDAGAVAEIRDAIRKLAEEGEAWARR